MRNKIIAFFLVAITSVVLFPLESNAKTIDSNRTVNEQTTELQYQRRGSYRQRRTERRSVAVMTGVMTAGDTIREDTATTVNTAARETAITGSIAAVRSDARGSFGNTITATVAAMSAMFAFITKLELQDRSPRVSKSG